MFKVIYKSKKCITEAETGISTATIIFNIFIPSNLKTTAIYIDVYHKIKEYVKNIGGVFIGNYQIYRITLSSKSTYLKTDKYNIDIGQKIAIAKAQRKVYKLMYNMCKMYQENLLKLLYGYSYKGNITIYNREDTIHNDVEKWHKLYLKENIYVNELINFKN